jgi:DNA-binding NarL/FixJ family response regulator
MEISSSGQETRSLILCVEDEPELRADILEELRASGHEAIGAADGPGALDLLDTVRPDLILCDISMPGMDGYQVLETVRQRRRDLGDVSFVFLTALNQRAEVISGKRSGADDYLVKPIDFDLLLASIDARIAQARRIRALHRVEGGEAAPALEERGLSRLEGEVLDLLSFGVILTNRECEVLFANVAAQRLADASRCFFLRQHLRAGSSDLSARLRGLVSEAVAAAEAGSDIMRGMSLPRPDCNGEIMLVICSLPGQNAGRPMAAIFISDPARQPAPPEHMMASLFGLTPAEAQVAGGLVAGRRTADIAQDLKISQTTVAFHLRNLFEKTGTNRQVDLVALVMKTLASVK